MNLAGDAPGTVIGRLRAIRAAQAKFKSGFAMAGSQHGLRTEKPCKDEVDEQRIGGRKADDAAQNA
jgi:hypothetical protein